MVLEIKKVGFVGLGHVGGALARHISKAGYQLLLADADPECVRRLVDDGIGVAARSLEELGAESDIVLTVLPSGAIVQKVLLGEPIHSGDHVARSIRAGTTVVDISAIAPEDTLRIGAALAQKQVGMLDAPVSGLRGGPRDARDGSLTVMVGGDERLIDHCGPIFRCLGHTVFRTGELGTAHAAKAMSNAVFSTVMLASIEALIIAKRYGIPPATMVDVLNASFGYNAATKVIIPEQVLSGRYAAGFKIAYMVKDLTSAMKVARETQMEPLLIAQVLKHWSSSMDEMGPDTDHSRLAEHWARKFGDTFGTEEKAG